MSAEAFSPDTEEPSKVEIAVWQKLNNATEADWMAGYAEINARRAVKKEMAANLAVLATPQEIKLKAWLDTKPMKTAWKFQRPLRGYVCDFLCTSIKTVIEVDGSYHTEQQDAIRDGALWRAGYQTLRFTNTDVDDAFDEAKARILQIIECELRRIAKGKP